MKEFIEKLIDRLEEVIQDVSESQGSYEVGSDMSITCSHIIGTLRDVKNRIIPKLAEEYSANTPQKSTGGWIPVTERLPKYDAESEYYEEVIVTLNNGIVTTGYYRNLDEEWWVQGRSMKCLKNSVYSVVAWQPFPKSYIPRGQWKDAVMNHFTKIE